MSALSEEIVQSGLSQIARTIDGTGYAFVKLNVSKSGLARLSKTVLKKYQHIRYLDASDNAIEDMSALSRLPNLLVADLSNNQLNGLGDITNEFLQILNLSNNVLSTVTFPSTLPSLAYLNLNNNQLWTLEGISTLSSLQKLDCSGNALSSTQGIGIMPSLREMNASGCGIKSLEGLKYLGTLESLNISKNQ